MFPLEDSQKFCICKDDNGNPIPFIKDKYPYECPKCGMRMCT